MNSIKVFFSVILTFLFLETSIVKAQEQDGNKPKKEKNGKSKKGKGALIGAGAGAATGAVVGGGKGAVIGAGAGAVGGAIIGRKKDKKKDPERYEQYSDKNKKE